MTSTHRLVSKVVEEAPAWEMCASCVGRGTVCAVCGAECNVIGCLTEPCEVCDGEGGQWNEAVSYCVQCGANVVLGKNEHVPVTKSSILTREWTCSADKEFWHVHRRELRDGKFKPLECDTAGPWRVK